MKKSKFEEVKNVFEKYVVNSNNMDVIEDILNKECNEKWVDLFVSESGKFLTDSFTFLKEMENVPQMYRERLFNSFYGSKKTDLTKKWFKTLFKNDNTFNKHLSSHVLCLMRGFINEQKRKYDVENVKRLKD
jgi:hypothetical protein